MSPLIGSPAVKMTAAQSLEFTAKQKYSSFKLHEDYKDDDISATLSDWKISPNDRCA